MKKGFTLIELLVVVLIIGILSSVALPQYQMAVMKSRVSSILPVLKNSLYALDSYYMANGSFTREWDAIDIVPDGCTHNSNSNAADIYVCGNDWLLTLDINGMVQANYCPGKNSGWTSCTAVRDFQIYVTSVNVTPNAHGVERPIGGIGCYYWTDSGKKLCNHLSASGMAKVTQ